MWEDQKVECDQFALTGTRTIPFENNNPSFCKATFKANQTTEANLERNSWSFEISDKKELLNFHSLQ
ncbi:hypothetical protein D3873_01100 [Paenisporosarcina cavernae]|uniref:Uncharacterized protein n=1 Tax=Paenisporosarcina cavernae TaxID=2320858 RepID=A0A385YS40_9BACL|nr:hypothetical protein D3873_01100 [Paenisporosarcina cavernae]